MNNKHSFTEINLNRKGKIFRRVMNTKNKFRNCQKKRLRNILRITMKIKENQ